ncbi:uncharacterized protein [Eurosta solidaginis]
MKYKNNRGTILQLQFRTFLVQTICEIFSAQKLF